MSTDMHLRCVTHDPYIQSSEVGHSTSDLPQIRAAILDSDRIRENIQGILEMDEYPQFEGNQATLLWFLFAHPMCDLEIWDEYGQQYSMKDTAEEKPIARDTVLGRIISVEELPEGVSVIFGGLTPEGQRVMQVIKNG